MRNQPKYIQAGLFNQKSTEEITQSVLELAHIAPEECYDYLREKGFSVGHALYLIAENRFEEDWKKLWNQYETGGHMVYCLFNIRGFEILIYEIESGIFCNDSLIFEWGENDKSDNKTTQKIKSNLKKHLIENSGGFEYLINQNKQ